jgi:hypothetical protein
LGEADWEGSFGHFGIEVGFGCDLEEVYMDGETGDGDGMECFLSGDLCMLADLDHSRGQQPLIYPT